MFSSHVAQAILAAHQDVPPDELPDVLANVCAVHFRKSRCVVAIDDLHYAQSAQTVRFLDALIGKTEGGVRWIIATRSKANLPLELWIAKGLCDLPVDENTLAFLDDDLAAALATTEVGLSSDDVATILSVTKGLPISVALALRYAKAGHDLADVTAHARSASYEYLTSQLYAELTEREQLYLCFGALLPSLRPDVFEAAGFEDASNVLYDLYRRSSFLTRRSGAGGSGTPEYVCHELFREYFADRLRLLGRLEQQALQKRAADALIMAELTTAALPLYAACGAFSELAECLAQHGYTLIEQGRRDVVRSAVNALPDGDARWRGTVLALRAELSSLREEWPVVAGMFTAAVASAASERERLATLFRFGQHQHLFDPHAAERTLESIVASADASERLRVHALAYLLATRTWNDPYCDISGPLSDFEARVHVIESDFDRADALLFACCAATFCGDPRAQSLGQTALEVAARQNMLQVLQAVYRTLAHNALYAGDDPHRVLDYVVQEEALAAQVEDERLRRSSVLLRLGLAMRLGDVATIEDLLLQYERSKTPSNSGVKSAALRARALLHAWRKEFGAAYELLARAVPSVYGNYRPIARALCAVLAAAADRREDAVRLIREGQTWLKSVTPWNDVLQRNTAITRSLFGIAAALVGKQRDALRLLRGDGSPPPGTLARTLSDFVRALLEGPAVTLAEEGHLCEQLRCSGYQDLAMIMSAVLQRYRTDLSDTAKLTAQEKKILEALESGFTPKQIAAMQDRQLSTIQGHIRSAVAKLGCSGRAQAVRIARSRGLLEG
jgi:DNA-binding CsgD family transcriptional regulator